MYIVGMRYWLHYFPRHYIAIRRYNINVLQNIEIFIFVCFFYVEGNPQFELCTLKSLRNFCLHVLHYCQVIFQ